MAKKRLAIIIMLAAGFIISVSCILFKINLVPGLLILASTLLVFYIIGRLITKLIDKINTDAENRAVELANAETVEQSEEEADNENSVADSEEENAEQAEQ